MGAQTGEFFFQNYQVFHSGSFTLPFISTYSVPIPYKYSAQLNNIQRQTNTSELNFMDLTFAFNF